MKKDKPLSEILEKELKRIGMQMAKEEEDKILKEFNLTSLDKEQIQGVSKILSYCNKAIIEDFKEREQEKVRRLKEEIKLIPTQRGDWNKNVIERVEVFLILDKHFSVLDNPECTAMYRNVPKEKGLCKCGYSKVNCNCEEIKRNNKIVRAKIKEENSKKFSEVGA